MSFMNNEFEVILDSDEFRACEKMAQQETPVEVAVLRLVDFYGMVTEDAWSYYSEATAEYSKTEKR
jgi:hypothetical protein